MNAQLKGLVATVATLVALPLAVMAQGNSDNAHAKVEIIQASRTTIISFCVMHRAN